MGLKLLVRTRGIVLGEECPFLAFGWVGLWPVWLERGQSEGRCGDKLVCTGEGEALTWQGLGAALRVST